MKQEDITDRLTNIVRGGRSNPSVPIVLIGIEAVLFI